MQMSKSTNNIYIFGRENKSKMKFIHDVSTTLRAIYTQTEIIAIISISTKKNNIQVQDNDKFNHIPFNLFSFIQS